MGQPVATQQHNENQNYSGSDFEDNHAQLSTTRPSVIRTQAGQYVQMTIHQDNGSNQFYLTLYEKLTRQHICTKAPIPPDFTQAATSEN